MSTTLPRPTDDAEDDLFAETKMSFGDHLNELRACLVKAVFALAIGCVIGLIYGETVMQWVEAPLKTALVDYYQARAIADIEAKLDERRKNGEAIPPELDSKAGIEELVLNQGLLFEETYVAPQELFDELRRHEPGLLAGLQWPHPAPAPQAAKPEGDAAQGAKPAGEAAAGAAAPGTAKPAIPKMMRIFLWHRADEDDRISIKSMNVQETFMIYMKAGLIAGAVLSSPAVFYFVWSFIAAGLYPHEKRYVHVFLPVSLGLFLGGVALSCFVFKPVLGFLFSFNRSMGIDPDPRISEWLGFALLLPLGFGVSFQLPLVMLFLERIGIFTVQSYLKKWKISVLVIAFASMVFSPGGDPTSMMSLFVPLTFLYFAGIAVCHYLPSAHAGAPRASRHG